MCGRGTRSRLATTGAVFPGCPPPAPSGSCSRSSSRPRYAWGDGDGHSIFSFVPMLLLRPLPLEKGTARRFLVLDVTGTGDRSASPYWPPPFDLARTSEVLYSRNGSAPRLFGYHRPDDAVPLNRCLRPDTPPGPILAEGRYRHQTTSRPRFSIGPVPGTIAGPRDKDLTARVEPYQRCQADLGTPINASHRCGPE